MSSMKGKNKLIEIRLSVEGMMCQKNCGSTLENALSSIAGATKASASFELSLATVTIDLSVFSSNNASLLLDTASSTGETEAVEEAVMETVENVGFDCRVLLPGEEAAARVKKQPSAMFDEESSEEEDGEYEEDGPIQAIYQIIGMSCTVCTTKIQRVLLSASYISTARVNLSSCQAKVQLASSVPVDENVHKCKSLIESLGYECNILQIRDHNKVLTNNMNSACVLDPSKQEMKAWRHLLLVSSILTIPLMYLHYGSMHMDASPRLPGVPPSIMEWLMLLLSTPVQFYVGKRFYVAAYRNLMHGCVLGMDALIVLGTSASYSYSIIIFILQYTCTSSCGFNRIHPNHEGSFMSPTFETSAMLLTFVTLGKYLEAYAKGKTAQALYKLLELQPSTALKIILADNDDVVLDATVNIPSLPTESLPLAQLYNNDFLLVLPGNRIPTDGILIATAASSSTNNNNTIYVDESAFSGEPFPISKSIGDSLIGCSMNQLSTIIVQVTATGQDTVISKIISCMEEAQSQVAPIQNFADSIASVFAPFVICCSITTFITWKIILHYQDHNTMSSSEQFFNAFMSSISVIVVACPCALGLATPTAVMVGTGVGASHGLLIKGGSVLEKAQMIDTIVFDKTGTLTTGKAVLNNRYDLLDQNTHYEIVGNNCPIKDTENISLWLASCAEACSEHPLSIAIVNTAKGLWGADYTHSIKHDVKITRSQIYPGDGVECCIQQHDWGMFMIRVGRKNWVLDLDHHDDHHHNIIDPIGDELAHQLRNEGQIVVFLSIQKLQTTQTLDQLISTDNSSSLLSEQQPFQILSLFSIIDPIKSAAQPCIQTLLNMNIDVWMCTGDHELSAHHVATSLGMDIHHVCANVHPQGKADLIKRLQKRSSSDDNDAYYDSSKNRWWSCSCFWAKKEKKRHVVAMVGDGINDAVALATADVGIAIGAGTEIAMEAASIVLIQNSLYDVITALHLSRKVFHRIKWNFFWALCYNVCSLPIAAGIFYPIFQWKLSPAFAGLMMAFSSVSVVMSSLMLRCYKKPKIHLGKDGKLLTKKSKLSIIDGFCCLSRRSKYTMTRTTSMEIDGLELV